VLVVLTEVANLLIDLLLNVLKRVATVWVIGAVDGVDAELRATWWTLEYVMGWTTT